MSSRRGTVRLKRVYDPPAAGDGYRVLVDRLWPRGLTKEAAAVDLWLKEVAPSTDLRRWFHADPARWPEFVTRYKEELAESPALSELRTIVRERAGHRGAVTLLYAARDEARNHAAVLVELVGKGA